VTTLLRICAMFEVPMAKLVRGLDEGIYERPTPCRRFGKDAAPDVSLHPRA
jgi:hypothetical protein